MSSTISVDSNLYPAISAGATMASRRPSVPGEFKNTRPWLSSAMKRGSSGTRSRKSERTDKTRRMGEVASSATAASEAVKALRSLRSGTSV